MGIRRFRAVVSVAVMLALLMPSAAVVPSARAQQGILGQVPQGGGAGVFNPMMPSLSNDFWLGPAQAPPIYQTAPLPVQQTPVDERLRPSPMAPGLCTSQTYQTLAVPRGSEVRNAATKVTPITTQSGTPEKNVGEVAKTETMQRADLDAISPIEASFQMPGGSSQALAPLIFEPPRAGSGSSETVQP